MASSTVKVLVAETISVDFFNFSRCATRWTSGKGLECPHIRTILDSAELRCNLFNEELKTASGKPAKYNKNKPVRCQACRTAESIAANQKLAEETNG